MTVPGWSFDRSGGPELGTAVGHLLDTLPAAPELLAVGEPAHGEPALPALRNRIVEALVEHGFRSVAMESDRVAALDVDAYVRGGDGALDTVLATGFTHGLGRDPATRELVAWARAYNAGRPAPEQLSVHGFDAPLEMMTAGSPRRDVRHLHGYLAERLGRTAAADLDALLGDDDRWTDPAAQLDPAASIGGSPEAVALRALVDDLLVTLYAEAPRLVAASSAADWYRAETHGRSALGLLRYHAVAAVPADPAERASRMLGARDAVMARNLLDIRHRERHRGPTVVLAHNRHLQRNPGTWRLAGMDLEWSGAGAIVGTLLGGRYAVVVGSIGASPALGLGDPAPETVEAALTEAAGGRCAIVPASGVDGGRAIRADVTPEQGYFPLDAATVGGCDAILHVSVGAGEPPTVDDLAARIRALPDVTVLVADEASGAPESNRGNHFYFVGDDRRMPFATIVLRNMEGDEESRLDRPGVFRLNLQVGRSGFERLFGYPPKDLPAHRDGLDFARCDVLMPHPVYGAYGWACVLNPGIHRLAELDRLLVQAHAHRHRR